MDLNGCVAFVTVVECGSFSGAARKLQIPRSTVSARVVALEAYLGVRLLRRTTRQIALTDEGTRYFSDLAPGIQTLKNANQRAQDSATVLSGSIRMSVPLDFPHHVMSAAIMSFRKLHPGVRFDILMDDRVSDFLTDNIDLAIRGRHPGSDDFVARKIATFTFGVFASPTYLAHSTQTGATPGQPRPDLMFSPPSSADNGSSGTALFPSNHDHHVSTNCFALLKQLAIDGAGTAILPTHICEDEIRQGRLIALDNTAGSSQADLFIVYPSRKDVNTKVRAFTAHLVGLLGK